MGNRSIPFQRIAYSLLAVLGFVVLWLLTFPGHGGQEEPERAMYPVVILGDSIMGLERDESSVSERLSGKIGRPIFNGAFGGTCLALQEGEAASDYTMELLSMVSLSKALAADDFGVQQTVRSRREITDYFEDTVDELSCIDFKRVEVLILEFGLNDYHAGIPLENEKDPMDETTYGGALRSVLKTFGECYPDMKIVLATPTYTWYLSNKLTCEEYETGDAFLEEYVNAELAIAEEFGIEALDLYHELYPHGEWEDWRLYTDDGLHPNEAGREMIAARLAQLHVFGD